MQLDRDPETGWAAGTAAGPAAIQRVGEAEVGDRTLVDALAPAVAELERGAASAAAARAASEGARGTADLRARRGRAGYVGDRARGLPDPGAMGRGTPVPGPGLGAEPRGRHLPGTR
ncbi:DAK2 domain-containing protein [Nonomuraea sp. MTCD27]|uniref:DAK2 domain-containing protein n=1 Tax=Nonomuraea sp. MTCD27 TaxID=1676747 RepID=UPI0035C0A06E